MKIMMGNQAVPLTAGDMVKIVTGTNGRPLKKESLKKKMDGIVNEAYNPEKHPVG